MKQIYGIAFLLLNSGFVCLAQPVSIENYSQLETNKKENMGKSSETQIKPNSPVEAKENWEEPAYSSTTEKYDKNEKTFENSHNSVISKDLSSSVETQNVPDTRKKFDNDFLPLEQRMPDFTDEEYSEINKEGATPWNFLKYIEDKPNVTQPATTQNAGITRVYINIPIVINSDTSLPISVTIEGENKSIKETNGTIDPSLFIKLKNCKDTPTRETNRHRSNFNKNIFAHSQNQQVEDVE